MSKSIAFVFCSLLLAANQSLAIPIWPGAIGTTLGATFIGLGGMFTVLAQRDDVDTRALYNTTDLVVVGYDVEEAPCRECERANHCTHYPFTARVSETYQVPSSNGTLSFSVNTWAYCGNTEADAQDFAQRSVPNGTSFSMLYLMSDPSKWTFNMTPSPLWGGAIFMYVFGGSATLIGALLLAKGISDYRLNLASGVQGPCRV